MSQGGQGTGTVVVKRNSKISSVLLKRRKELHIYDRVSIVSGER